MRIDGTFLARPRLTASDIVGDYNSVLGTLRRDIMTSSTTYQSDTDRFDAAVQGTVFSQLSADTQRFIRHLATTHRFSFQEIRLATEAARDLAMWEEAPLEHWWMSVADADEPADPRAWKKLMLRRLAEHMAGLRKQPKTYSATVASVAQPPLHHHVRDSDRNVVGMCPVASEETVCCNLRTIDAVENCGFGCRYCTIQTFYGDRITFDRNFREKLFATEIEPDRFIHFGTGQSSDSLMWGNQHGVLDALCEFAARHPNILVEFKTKSKNISYFMRHDVPRNIVLSWSLNTRTIIEHEELHTASLEQRLRAARKVADRGIRVAFHFHPLVYYDTWQDEYTDLARTVTQRFQAHEVLFCSMGSVTFIKPVMQAIRRRGGMTKMLQMEFARDPKGKFTYPDKIKTMMFSAVYEALTPWHSDVFFYLCMEKATFWLSTFGFVYPDNTTFEREFGAAVMAKLPPAVS